MKIEPAHMSLEESNALRLVYDGDCPLCQGIVNGLARLGLVGPERTKPFQDYQGETSERLWDAGIRNEIAVLEETTGTIRSGVDGLIWILRSSWARPIVALAALPPFLWLARSGYALVAYNRHLLAPKDPARIRCACNADFRPGYRLALLVPALVFALAVAIAFASSVAPAEPVVQSEGKRFPFVLLALAGAWVAAALVGLRGPRERAFDWLGHLVLAADLGAVALLPAVILARYLDGPVLRAVQIGAVGVAVLAVSGSLSRRVRAMGLGRGWFLAALFPLAAGGLLVLLPLTS